MIITTKLYSKWLDVLPKGGTSAIYFSDETVAVSSHATQPSGTTFTPVDYIRIQYASSGAAAAGGGTPNGLHVVPSGVYGGYFSSMSLPAAGSTSALSATTGKGPGAPGWVVMGETPSEVYLEDKVYAIVLSNLTGQIIRNISITYGETRIMNMHRRASGLGGSDRGTYIPLDGKANPDFWQQR